MLFIDTPNPRQRSEVTLYVDKQYRGRTMVNLHEQYDGFATDCLTGKITIDFHLPEGASE